MPSIEEQIKDIKKRLEESKGTPAEAIFQSVLTQLESQLDLQKQGGKKTSKNERKDASPESSSPKSKINKNKKFSPRKPTKTPSAEKQNFVPAINYHYYSGAKIELLNLSPPIIDAMRQAEVLTIADILKTGKEKLQKIDNLDEQGFTEVAAALKKQARIDLDNYTLEAFNKQKQENNNENLSENKNVKETKTKKTKTEETQIQEINTEENKTGEANPETNNIEATVKESKVKQTKKQTKKKK